MTMHAVKPELAQPGRSSADCGVVNLTQAQ